MESHNCCGLRLVNAMRTCVWHMASLRMQSKSTYQGMDRSGLHWVAVATAFCYQKLVYIKGLVTRVRFLYSDSNSLKT